MGLTIRPSDLLGAIFVVGPSGRIVHWSQGAAELLGIPPERALRHPFREVLATSAGARDEWLEVCAVVDRSQVPRPFALELGAPPRRALCALTVCRVRGRRYLIGQLHLPLEASGSQPRPALTARETEVLELLAQGEDTVGIGQVLGIATPTVRNHLRRLLQKLGAHSRLEAVVIAAQAGLVRL